VDRMASDASEVRLERFRTYLRMLAGLHMDPRLRGKLDPSDLVQDALLKAHQALHQFHGSSDRERMAWLRQILANTLANAVRDFTRAKRDVALERSLEAALQESSSRLELWLAASGDSPGQRAERDEQVLRVSRELAALPEPQRQALLLKYCQGWSMADIGRHLDRTPAAVASLVRRGLERLRERLRDPD
jgi:RNA polymerase sigma-70 factor, ECF subfamily